MSKYISFEELKAKLIEHLIKYRRYGESDAKLATCDFTDPYDYELCDCSYIEECEICGEEYIKRAYWIDFTVQFGRAIDTYGAYLSPEELEEYSSILKEMDKPFCFYTYFKIDDDFDQTVGAYKRSKRLYQVEDLNMDDFNV